MGRKTYAPRHRRTGRFRPSVPRGPKWECVQGVVRCAGDRGHEMHDIGHGQWALFWPWRAELPRFILCEPLALTKGYRRADALPATPPPAEKPRPWTSSAPDDATDARARRSGESEEGD